MHIRILISLAACSWLAVGSTACVDPGSTSVGSQTAALGDDAGEPESRAETERGEELAVPELTDEDRAAQAELDDTLNSIERAAGRPLPEALADVGAEELQRVADLVRRASPDTVEPRWEPSVRATLADREGSGELVPTSAQIDALRSLAEHSVSSFDVQWAKRTGTPGALIEVGYVRRDPNRAGSLGFISGRPSRGASSFV